jgi:hypothetical protein
MVAHSLAAAKRLRKELQVLQKSPVDADIALQHNPDNLLQWKAWIHGPTETPYQGGVFELDIRCGVDYPLAPPSIKFVTKVRSGTICRRYGWKRVGRESSKHCFACVCLRLDDQSAIYRMFPLLLSLLWLNAGILTHISILYTADIPPQCSFSNRRHLFGYFEKGMVSRLGAASGLSSRIGPAE